MKALIVDRYSKDMTARLEAELNCRVSWSTTLQPNDDELADAEIIFIRSRTRVDSDFFKKAKKLQLLISATAGFDHIDTKSIPSPVKVAHTPEANTQSAAELTLLFLLALSRQFKTSTNCLQKKHWRDSISPASELYGQHLGLLGLGRVGQKVAQMAKVFGLHISAYDPYQSDDIFKQLHVERVGLTELFAQSDFLSLHVPLTKETRHIIKSSTIELMPDHISIINTSRGAVVSECELIMALEQKSITAAALDVFESEPLSPDSKLHGFDNVILTPHVGAFTEQALQRASEMAYLRAKEFLKDNKTQFQVPPAAAWAQYLL